jgi:hypothetical protein
LKILQIQRKARHKCRLARARERFAEVVDAEVLIARFTLRVVTLAKYWLGSCWLGLGLGLRLWLRLVEFAERALLYVSWLRLRC